MKKIAVIFPGIGYTAQKPLLYYTASAAQDEGYQLLKLDYGEDIHTFRGRKEEELKPLIEKAQVRVKKQLEVIDWGQYEQILFLSKSIGTVIACSRRFLLRFLIWKRWMDCSLQEQRIHT